MANTWILYKNLWRTARLTPSSEDPEYPANYSRDDSGQLWYQSAAAALTPNIVGDLGSAQSFNFVALIGHNLTAGASIQLQGADDAGITSNVDTDTIAFNGNNIFQRLPATRTHRYVQVLVSDASNPSNYIKIATIVIGMINDLGRQYGGGSSIGYPDASETQRPPSGMRLLVQEMAAPKTLRGYRWMGLSDSTALVIGARDQECGRRKSFLLCFDISSPNSNSYWVETPSPQPLTRNGPNDHEWDPGDIQETL